MICSAVYMCNGAVKSVIMCQLSKKLPHACLPAHWVQYLLETGLALGANRERVAFQMNLAVIWGHTG